MNMPVFDMKRFLSAPLNEGNEYLDYKGRFCQKGAFCLSVMGVDFSSLRLQSLEENEVERHQSVIRVSDTAVKAYLAMLFLTHPKLLLALDIAEYIHLYGYPQRAKLFLAYVIDKFNLAADLPTGLEDMTLWLDRNPNKMNKFILQRDLEEIIHGKTDSAKTLDRKAESSRNWMSPDHINKIRPAVKTFLPGRQTQSA